MDRLDPAASRSRARPLGEVGDSELEQERLAIEHSLMRFEEIEAENLENFDPDDSLMSLGLGLGIKVPKHLSNKARIKSAAVQYINQPLGGTSRGAQGWRRNLPHYEVSSPKDQQAAASLHRIVNDI